MNGVEKKIREIIKKGKNLKERNPDNFKITPSP